MTIGGWLLFGCLAFCFIGVGIFFFVSCETVAGRAAGLSVGIIATILLLTR